MTAQKRPMKRSSKGIREAKKDIEARKAIVRETQRQIKKPAPHRMSVDEKLGLIEKKKLKPSKASRRADPPRYRLWELERWQLEEATPTSRGVWIRERELLVRCLAAYWVFNQSPDIHWLAENKPWVHERWAGHHRFVKAQMVARECLMDPLVELEKHAVAIWEKEGLIHEQLELLVHPGELIRL